MTIIDPIFELIKEIPLWLKIIIPLSIFLFISGKKSSISNDLNRRIELMKWNMRS
jgi:hypothetical protein